MIGSIAVDDACFPVSGTAEDVDAVSIGLDSGVSFFRTEPGNAEAFPVCKAAEPDPLNFSFARIDTADTGASASSSVSFVLVLSRPISLFFLLIEILHRHDDPYLRLVEIVAHVLNTVYTQRFRLS